MGLFWRAYCWWVTDNEPLNIRETLSALYSEGPLVGGGMMCILTSMGQNQVSFIQRARSFFKGFTVCYVDDVIFTCNDVMFVLSRDVC